MDSITISDLELRTRIGITDSERSTEQKVLVTVAMKTDITAVSKNDDVSAGIDYAVVREKILTLATVERRTIERFAEDIAQMILSNFRASGVTVAVKKFPFPDSAHVQIVIDRTNR